MRTGTIVDATVIQAPSITKNQDFVPQEVLGVDSQFAPCKRTTWDLNGEKAIIHIEKVTQP